ncbi:MAG TPA: 4-phosphoerythronate dehydrogenase, partial [Rhodothermia bacterium]
IFADENIPAVEETFGRFGDVTAVSGRRINREMLLQADVLLVRAVTRVDAALLAGTPVKFVGTATAGFDHIHVDGLRNRGIEVAHAPGSNAPSVCDYVIAAILRLAVHGERRLTDLTCSVIGCGAVGGKLATRLEHLGLTVLRSDPPLHDALAARGLPSPFVDTDEAIPRADVVTLHVPLHDREPYSTFGLLDRARLNVSKDSAWIINTSRGQVVDEEDLVNWLEDHPTGRAVVDVWTNEPDLSCDLLARASIGTAHIAGYAAEGKLRASRMMQDALARWIGAKVQGEGDLPEPIELNFDRRFTQRETWLDEIVRSVYDIEMDHNAMAPMCEQRPEDRASFFDSIRRNYPLRHEFSRYRLRASAVPPGLEHAITGGVGMSLRDQ